MTSTLFDFSQKSDLDPLVIVVQALQVVAQALGIEHDSHKEARLRRRGSLIKATALAAVQMGMQHILPAKSVDRSPPRDRSRCHLLKSEFYQSPITSTSWSRQPREV
jgi:hypothetical protein